MLKPLVSSDVFFLFTVYGLSAMVSQILGHKRLLPPYFS